MELFARKPDPLPDKKPMDKTWNTWRQEFIIFLQVAGIDKKSSRDKAALLMNIIGKVGLEVLQNMDFEDEDQKYDYDLLLQKFDDYYNPPKIETQERFKFYTRSKKNNETIEAYIEDLREKAKTCNFGDLAESLVRDMVILDVKDKHFRNRIFEEKNLDLNTLILFYKKFELDTEKMKDVSKKVSSENSEAKSTNENASTETKKENKNPCWKCGKIHPMRACPAFKIICEKCKEKGHYTQRCKNKNVDSKSTNPNININKPVDMSKVPMAKFKKNI